MNRLIPLGVFLLLGALLWAGLYLNPREVPSPLVGRAAPAFEAPALHDPQSTVSHEALKGRVSLVNVWASWCVACLQEHPLLVRLAQTDTVPLVGLNYKDTRPKALAWLRRNGNAYSVSAFDPEGRVGLDWGVYGVPETFVVDADGVIRHKHIGPIDERSLQETLLPLIEKLKAEQASG
ncbi:MAG: DsbE family thiol:disulfide interchange protein [Candidatus Competibacteraceae bacterium]|nr:DsbE family thiol:disulfide interchange protein [Candidatus Competibacteraceae bacterium]